MSTASTGHGRQVSDPVLTVRGVSKRFGPTVALRDVGFSVQPGHVHALLGANGAGKSTMIKILAGVYAADGGRIEIAGEPVTIATPSDSRDAGIAVIHQQLTVVPSLTVAENLLIRFADRAGGLRRPFAGPDRAAAARMVDAALDAMGSSIDPRMLAGTLTFGERQILEIAMAAAADARVLIMDEPSSGLSAREQEALFGVVNTLTERGVGIIYVSHKMDEVFRLSHEITVLRGGAVVAEFSGDTIRPDEVVAAIVGETAPAMQALHRESIPARSGTPRLSATGIVTDRVDGIDLAVHPGEILGVYGAVGAGTAQLVEALAGGLPSSGAIEMDGSPVRLRSRVAAKRLGVEFVPSDHRTRGAIPEMTITENMLVGDGRWRTGLYRRVSKATTARVERLANALSIKRASLDQHIEELSGGNQQKVVFGRSVFQAPRVLLLDDPTQGIDVGARRDIFTAISRQREQGTGIVFVSSEPSELTLIADRVLVVHDGRIVRELVDDDITDQAILTAAAVSGDEQ